MGRIADFDSVHLGSSPSPSATLYAPLVQLDQNATLRTLRSEVRILQGVPSIAPVMELVYVSDSKSEFCGFDSRLGHQLIGDSPSGKASDFDSDIPRFDPWIPSQVSD